MGFYVISTAPDGRLNSSYVSTNFAACGFDSTRFTGFCVRATLPFSVLGPTFGRHRCRELGLKVLNVFYASVRFCSNMDWFLIRLAVKGSFYRKSSGVAIKRREDFFEFYSVVASCIKSDSVLSSSLNAWSLCKAYGLSDDFFFTA